MIRKCRLHQLLAMVWSLFSIGAVARAQALPDQTPPDLVPSTVITDGAPSFHLPHAENALWDSSSAFDTTAAAQGSNGEGFVSRAFKRGLHGGDTHAKETGILGIETLANTFLVYMPLQVIAGRQRPNEGTGEGNFFVNHSVNTSFPGGHSMFAFSMATVIAHEYPKWWVQLLSYGAASAITGARMTAKDHFPSDLLVGGALGYLIGTHVFHSHCNPDLGGDCHPSDKREP
jgi:hypothetical protein